MSDNSNSGVRHTSGPLKAVQGIKDETDRWVIVTDGPREYHVATIENGQPGDTLETEGATARLFAASLDLFAVAKAYEVWEGDLVLNGDWSNSTVCMTQAQHDRFLEIQAMRNAAIAKAEGRTP